MPAIALFVVLAGTACALAGEPPGQPAPLRSARTGSWSEPATWEKGKVPGAGAVVLIRAGHTVRYDLVSNQAIRSIHIAGTLAFAPDRDTELCAGLIRIEAGEKLSADGFDCTAHLMRPVAAGPRPSLLVGTAEQPVRRLPRSDPAGAAGGYGSRHLPGDRLLRRTHGIARTPMNRTWVKLGAPARPGDRAVVLAEPVRGWQPGDRVIITATKTHNNGRERGTLRAGVAGGRSSFTEERIVKVVADRRLELDLPLGLAHEASSDGRAEVANLTRNVVVESADPARGRGHTMYHRGSAGSISYAEFRHLGKEGVLGKYSLHFHQVGETMRGSSVVGASIWDSGNRWITIHGTNDLLVRDCVGYRSVGHGFYLEDGSETRNILDRNLAVQAFAGKPLPGQFLEFDRNEGAGFWWANSLNSFTRNVAVECDRYGYRYEAVADSSGTLLRPVLLADGRTEPVDIRTLPFLRFEGNEAHAQLGGMNMGEGAGGVGPDERHPFLIRDLKIWESLWAFQPGAPSIVLDGIDVRNAKYAIFMPRRDPQVRPYGRMTGRGVNQPSFLLTGPTAAPGQDTPLPVGIDDRPPCTIITSVGKSADGRVLVRGTTVDNGRVARVVVNGREARPLATDFLEWEITLDDRGAAASEITAFAVDAAGNVEPRPHVVMARQ